MKILRWMKKWLFWKIGRIIHLARKKCANNCLLTFNQKTLHLNAMDSRCMLILLNCIRKGFNNHTKMHNNQVKPGSFCLSTQISAYFQCHRLLKKLKWHAKPGQWWKRSARSLLGIRRMARATLKIMILKMHMIQIAGKQLWQRSLHLILPKINTKILWSTRLKTHRHQHFKSIRFTML